MAREILFKAKRTDNGEWVEGFYVETVEGHYIVVPNKKESIWSEGKIIEVDQNTLCQYTGLTDKNGNKIWENDVIEIPREDEYFKIEWEEDKASFVMSSDSLIVTFDNYWSHEVEVIGNIFDNPELLGGGE